MASLIARAAEAIDRRFGWSRLPRLLALPVLIGLRTRLREKNLHDTGRGPLDRPPFTDPNQARHRGARTIDGTYNDLSDPLMGSIGSRFGRNVPLEHTWPDAAPEAARSEPTPDQPRAAHARDLPAGDDPEPPRGCVDPVRGPRLVQPRRQRPCDVLGDPARRRRPVAAEPDADRPDSPGSELGARQAEHLRHRRHALVGRLADLRQHARVRRRDSVARARQAEARRRRPAAAGARCAHRLQGRGRQLLGRPRAAALAVHARAQRRLRPPSRGVPGAVRPAALREGAARRRGADGEDPHGRLDSGDHRAPDDGARDAGELVRPARRALRPDVRATDEERGDSRHPRLADEPPRRSLLAHGGVRGGLPDAPADPGRVRVPLPRGRLRAPGARATGAGCPRGAKPARRDVDDRHALLVRPPPSGCDHPAQLPTVPPGLPPAGRRPHRPCRDRRPAGCASGECRATTTSGGSSI